MKKQYIKPALEQVTVVTESLLDAASLEIDSASTISSDSEMGAKRNAFDLWGEDEE